MSSRALPSLLAAAALLAACGTEAGGGPGSGNDQEPETRLQVEVRATRGAEPVSGTLTCDPAGGDHPLAQQACAALETHAEALEPVPADVACTEIYGGPETASVTGTLRGRDVQASLSRTNGCEIARWDALEPLLLLRD